MIIAILDESQEGEQCQEWNCTRVWKRCEKGRNTNTDAGATRNRTLKTAWSSCREVSLSTEAEEEKAKFERRREHFSTTRTTIHLTGKLPVDSNVKGKW